MHCGGGWELSTAPAAPAALPRLCHLEFPPRKNETCETQTAGPSRCAQRYFVGFCAGTSSVRALRAALPELKGVLGQQEMSPLAPGVCAMLGIGGGCLPGASALLSAHLVLSTTHVLP